MTLTVQQFDASVNLLQTILWQYNEAPNLNTLMNAKQTWYTTNQTQFWNNWFINVFNVLAPDPTLVPNVFGLAVWAIILGVPLFVPEEIDPAGKPIFGFNQSPPINDYQNFFDSNFSIVGDPVSLTLDEQKFVLRLRYYQLCTRGAIYSYDEYDEQGIKVQDPMGINNFLLYLTSTSPAPLNGSIYVLDGLDMTMTYVFNYNVSQRLLDVLINYDLLPRPAAVGLKVIVLNSPHIFGFNEIVSTFPFKTLNTYSNFFDSNFFSPFI